MTPLKINKLHIRHPIQSIMNLTSRRNPILHRPNRQQQTLDPPRTSLHIPSHHLQQPNKHNLIPIPQRLLPNPINPLHSPSIIITAFSRIPTNRQHSTQLPSSSKTNHTYQYFHPLSINPALQSKYTVSIP
ncbi:hypothetical protein E2P81_ATG04354 [Venturia nashicola]|uniref:Uncharacterized protein n=1 Tax=Venturia nashicola TaxID=86259 RepID=A0A4Z1P7Z2_9PEZI|nr:hypothetical protein E6O75_ATG04458 [Venturia nashicola]TLD37542.1 hypothetical protein E2P81_ATG04354 [Venturia nashicola]